jgi:hypothetical protein
MKHGLIYGWSSKKEKGYYDLKKIISINNIDMKQI